MRANDSIFKKGSNTYYYSSLFFPKTVRDEVTTLYVFVRILDDLVDNIPSKKKRFYQYWQYYKNAWQKKCGIGFIDRMVELSKKNNFKREWIDAFWKSMEMDLIKPKHKNLTETELYMYGSAEVIGLMMAKIMGLSEEAQETAKKLGKAMQYANFIRDYREDVAMGRDYLQVKDKNDFFKKFSLLKNRFDRWQQEAEVGYKYLPKRYLIPVKTAAKMYQWTIDEIAKDPEVVFYRKVKPSKLKIIITGVFLSFAL